jgi:pSer/pThr/pTyr-binding forkhead associated (FHA) protein
VETQLFPGLHVPKIEASIVELKQDGTTGKATRIVKETAIGRGTCEVSYPNDPLLSPRHASLQIRAGKLMLKDLGSQNGTFTKQRQDTELTPGDVFLTGRELFRFVTQSMDEQPGPSQGTQFIVGAPKLQRGPVTAKLERIQLTGEVIEEFSLDKPEITLGRTKGDLVFQDDPFMSGTHARIVAQPGRFLLQDLKSRNGVYRRIRNEAELRDGDEFFLGEQLFRVEMKTS